MSDLRSRTIRLAYADPELRPYLVNLLRSDRVARVFDTQAALDAYLVEHPNADVSRHRVRTRTNAPGTSVGGKMRDHLEHVLFDDVEDAWSETKDAFDDVIKAVDRVKTNARNRHIISAFRRANRATKTFFSNRTFRRRKMRELGKSIKDGAKALGRRILQAVKGEVKDVWTGVKALAQVMTPNSSALTKEQKKGLYSLGSYVVGASVTAAGGGALMASGAVAKSFALHVGIKSVSQAADALANHVETAQAGGNFLLHIAASKDELSDKQLGGIVEAMVLAVAKVLDEGMSDDDVARMLSGEDDDAYGSSEVEIPAIDKLKAKADLKSAEAAAQQARQDLGEAQQEEAKSDKEASLRGRVIRLAHARPDLRPHLLAVISEK